MNFYNAFYFCKEYNWYFDRNCIEFVVWFRWHKIFNINSFKNCGKVEIRDVHFDVKNLPNDILQSSKKLNTIL